MDIGAVLFLFLYKKSRTSLIRACAVFVITKIKTAEAKGLEPLTTVLETAMLPITPHLQVKIEKSKNK